MTSIDVAGREVAGKLETSEPRAARLPASDGVEASEEQRNTRVLTKLISAELVMLLIVGLVVLFWKDWSTLSAVGAAIVLQLAPLWLIRHRHLQAGGALFVVINILVTTSIAMVGQGIYDLAIIAFPIIFVFAGLGLSRTLFRLCVGLGVAAVCWLVVAENNGWIVPKPLPDDPSHSFYLIAVITLLLVAAFAVSLLVTNLRNGLARANQEIVQRKRTEAALAKSERLARALLDATTDIATLVDEKGNIIDLNLAAATALHSSREKLLGTCVYDRFTQERASRRRQWVKEAAETGVPFVKEDEGQGRIFESRIYPIVAGESKQVVIFARDVTERKRAASMLEESEAKFRTLAEESPNMIFINQHGHVIYANARCAEVMGYGMDELYSPGFDFTALVAPESRAAVMANFSAHGQGRDVAPYEYSLVAKDGKTINCILSSKLINYDDGPAILGTITDITARKQVEKVLRESEQKYRDLVENAPVGIVVTSIDGRVLEVNKTLTQMHGYESREEFVKSPVADRFYDVKDRESWVALVQQTGKVDGFEVQTRRKDGSLFWTSTTSIPRTTETGEQQLITVSQDITERKRAEEFLRFSDAAFQSIHEAVQAMDNNFVVTRWNEKSEKMFGVKASDAIGKYVGKVVSMVEQYHGQNKKRLELLIARGYNQEEQIWRTPRGDIWVDVHAQAIESDGNRVGWVTLAADITERKQVEAKLEHAAEEWRTTFDSITDLISIHDKNNRLLRVNKAFARKLGTTPAEIIGKACHEVNHGTHLAPGNCPALKTLETGKAAAIEIFDPKRETWLQETTYPICGDSGEVVSTVHIVKDVTERRQMEQQLMMTDRLASIGELVSGIAHELNNPLTGVIGFSQLLMEKNVADDVKEDLTIISSEAERAGRIVKNLLTFARKHAPVKQPSQMNAIVEDVLRLRAYEQKTANIEVVKQLSPDLPEIMADYYQIQQVFLNLIINAEFFMIESHRGGTLTITTERVDGVVRSSFADDGPGISPENLSRIFDPFFTTKEVGKGTGLGLSICHGIVIEHGGKIHATSELGKGATFVVELPVDEPMSQRGG